MSSNRLKWSMRSILNTLTQLVEPRKSRPVHTWSYAEMKKYVHMYICSTFNVHMYIVHLIRSHLLGFSPRIGPDSSPPNHVTSNHQPTTDSIIFYSAHQRTDQPIDIYCLQLIRWSRLPFPYGMSFQFHPRSRFRVIDLSWTTMWKSLYLTTDTRSS